MELREYADILRKNWILVVVATILGVALGAGISLLMSPKYEATTQVYVATRAGEGSTVELVQGVDYSRQMINSYVDILETGVVLEPVVDQLNLDVPAHELAEYVRADAPENSSLINIVAESTSPEEAALIANTVRESFDEALTNQLELTDPVAGSPVSLTTTQVALVPEEPVSPNVLLNLTLGLLGGLAVGVVAAVVRGAFDTRIHNVRDVQGVTDVPVIGGIYEMKDASE